MLAESTIGLVMGCALLALGLVPGLVQDVMEAIRRFSEMLTSFPARPPHSFEMNRGQRLPGQQWFAVFGGLLILLSLYHCLAG